MSPGKRSARGLVGAAKQVSVRNDLKNFQKLNAGRIPIFMDFYSRHDDFDF